MITISWYRPWNNKIRKIILLSLLMCSLVSEILGITFLRFFFPTTPGTFSKKNIKTKLRHSADWKHKVVLEKQQKQSWESHLKSWRLAALPFLSCELCCRLANRKHAPTEVFLIFQRYWASKALLDNCYPTHLKIKLFYVDTLGTITLVWRPVKKVELLCLF